MNAEDLEQYLRALGYEVETLSDQNGQPYIVVREYRISAGGLKGASCDIALANSGSVPFQVPAAIHTKPALVPMGTLNTQASPLGPEWQYWSRRYDRIPAPRGICAHFATIFLEVAA